MDKYRKWQDLLTSGEKRQEWIDFYESTDAVFAEVLDFLKAHPDSYETADLTAIAELELAIIAILDSKVKVSQSKTCEFDGCRELATGKIGGSWFCKRHCDSWPRTPRDEIS